MAAALFYFTAGLVLALMLRTPARRLFGAGPAFTLWLLPPVLAALPWLPAPPASWSLSSTLLALPAAQSLLHHAGSSASGLYGIRLVWMIGALAFVVRLAVCYGRLLRQAAYLPEAMWADLKTQVTGLKRHRLRLHGGGPAVLWAWRPLLLLPPDFLERFDAAERQLIIQHEQTHLRRGDPLWSLLAELIVALFWFHPLAWLALPRFRLDQERACDECVLRQRPHDEGRYAQTLLRSNGNNAASGLIPWFDPPQLMERLIMIRRQRTSARRRHLGYCVLIAAITACAMSAQAATLTHAPGGASSDLEYNSRMQPHYPKASILQKEQGTVVLNVLVDPRGMVKSVDYDAKASTTTSASLIGAASDAAFQWHFNPAVENGKPIESYARVPVKFSMSPI
ncbi:MAG: TonB family protein [Pseudomonadota bacterium]|nr:TonB family protein [Pseudomonadota bacterium]